MRYEVDKQADKTIFTLKAETLGHEIAADLKTELVFLQRSTEHDFIIDLGQVKKCDSSGLSCLLLSERMEREKGKKLLLQNVNKNVLDLIKLARLERVFEFVN